MGVCALGLWSLRIFRFFFVFGPPLPPISHSISGALKSIDCRFGLRLLIARDAKTCFAKWTSMPAAHLASIQSGQKNIFFHGRKKNGAMSQMERNWSSASLANVERTHIIHRGQIRVANTHTDTQPYRDEWNCAKSKEQWEFSRWIFRIIEFNWCARIISHHIHNSHMNAKEINIRVEFCDLNSEHFAHVKRDRIESILRDYLSMKLWKHFWFFPSSRPPPSPSSSNRFNFDHASSWDHLS